MKKITSIVFAVLLCISLSFHLCSCYRTQYRFMYEISKITKIELVECGYGIEENQGYENVLSEISDTRLFMEELSRVKYTMPLYNDIVRSFKYSDLGIKISYENGDFEIIGNSKKTEYRVNAGYDLYNAVGEFDNAQYEALLNKYLMQCKSPTFYFMHDTKDIEKIEIVDAYVVKDSTSGTALYYQDKIKEVNEIASFIENISDLTYTYKVVSGGSSGRYNKYEHRNAIKIYYFNGDYEVIDNNWRDFYIKRIDQYVNNAYIGEFNSDEFYSLLISF